ncbi:hypothetical protein P4533_01930 [Geobacillus stearothermophilus]|uniref:hypothetical protein n=1 Tax=Geobacillus stearothermophilus TaxID=1422 RepID=UPI001877216B|nr:hypothetical protein [Geobacillus stearothermophilus]MED3783160.1 hypothetical protein [Geobacillus stearothermophilus]QOR83794.1 hypothetical protein IMZ17_14730 [Geobacillus stearothermophilus]
MNKGDWTRFLATLTKFQRKKVDHIEFELVAENLRRGAIRITDLQLQEGEQVTAAIPNTAEWFQPAYGTLDETSTAVGGDVYLGDQPRVFENVKNRFYNIVGRGHEAIIVPNVYETDFSRQLTTTVVDITLYAKNDFDLLRISTNYGDYVDEYERVYPDEPEHPLNKRYSREFFFEGGAAGSEIRLWGSRNEASINGVPANRASRSLPVGNGTLKIRRQLFMGLPYGSNRIRIEFYKLVNGKMQDVGIGFWGIVELIQWQEGKSKP